ncbi:hypothetical protein EYC80_000354 [Monilinia laxa]|uniref:Uncharacterized protein n=1 Tax=Monilinia laxa TaxID=61186 RepID=A0A5N6KAG0_MONLA|nr:hypothetical protein EYC80_000354 [Monilinia laxa]
MRSDGMGFAKIRSNLMGLQCNGMVWNVIINQVPFFFPFLLSSFPLSTFLLSPPLQYLVISSPHPLSPPLIPSPSFLTHPSHPSHPSYPPILPSPSSHPPILPSSHPPISSQYKSNILSTKIIFPSKPIPTPTHLIPSLTNPNPANLLDQTRTTISNNTNGKLHQFLLSSFVVEIPTTRFYFFHLRFISSIPSIVMKY